MDLVGHLDVMRREAERALSTKAFPKFGTVASYDPNTYRARVTLEPEGILSNWMPIASQFVGGGWGLFLGPSIGDLVLCTFVDGDFQSGVIGSGFLFTPQMPSVACPSGQAMLIHSSGTYIKLMNSGDLDLNAAGNLNLSVAGNSSITVTGNLVADVTGSASVTANGATITSSTVTVDGNLDVSGAISFGSGGSGSMTGTGNINLTGGITTSADVVAGTISLQNHLTTGVTSGSSNSGPPTG